MVVYRIFRTPGLVGAIEGEARGTPILETVFSERNREILLDGRWLAYQFNVLNWQEELKRLVSVESEIRIRSRRR